MMYEIYNKAYCNLSATASAGSHGGLFRKREPHTLWEDEINLNVEGIPVDPEQGSQVSIQRCVIQDLSFWARTIDDAPVNRRGWVLQERMMASRVIHFCENQIAWECNHLEAAESARDGVPSLHIQPIKPATDSVPPVRPEDYYVTLSHCWGAATFKCLSPENESELLSDGITIKELPKTFRHAIKFARRLGSVPTFEPRTDLSKPLPTVRYIWIDSLCIIQG